MWKKLKEKQIYEIAGVSGLMVAIYMLTLDNSGGFIPLIIGGVLLWIGYKK